MVRHGLQLLLVVLAAVAITAGGLTVLTGGSMILGGGDIPPGVDSELRFYAAWYVGVGLLMLWTAPRVESATLAVRAVCGVLLLAAAGRIISVMQVGRPPDVYLWLLGVELAVPLVLLPWQALVASAGQEGSETDPLLRAVDELVVADRPEGSTGEHQTAEGDER